MDLPARSQPAGRERQYQPASQRPILVAAQPEAQVEPLLGHRAELRVSWGADRARVSGRHVQVGFRAAELHPAGDVEPPANQPALVRSRRHDADLPVRRKAHRAAAGRGGQTDLGRGGHDRFPLSVERRVLQLRHVRQQGHGSIQSAVCRLVRDRHAQLQNRHSGDGGVAPSRTAAAGQHGIRLPERLAVVDHPVRDAEPRNGAAEGEPRRLRD